MCWISSLKAGQKLKSEYIDKAQSINKDGYGVMYYKNEQVNIFRTMDYEEFKTFLDTIEDCNRVIHLRYTSMGKTTIDNVHPFSVGNGAYMLHNGTLSSMRTCSVDGCGDDDSDTKQLAHLIKSCSYTHISDILPLIQQITGKTGNKLVFMEANGEITIVNKNLGVEEDDIWYSNEYHVTKTYTPSTYSNDNAYYNYYNRLSTAKTKVFVYGTLKKGFSNHYILSTSKLVGEATTCSTYAMIGTGMPFPYVLGIRSAELGGLNITGEVYEVDASTLQRLDVLEGVPHHYKKQQVLVKIVNGSTTKYETVSMYVKTTVTASDLQKPFISEFLRPANFSLSRRKYTPNYAAFKMKSDAELMDMGQIELCFYLDELEKLYYDKTFNSHKNYKMDFPELIDEIDALHELILDDFQELMSKEDKKAPFDLSEFENYLDD